MRRVLATVTVIGVVAALGALVAPTALAAPRLLQVSPKQVSFGTQPVGSLTFEGVTVTNTSSVSLLVLVDAVELPDDFNFGNIGGLHLHRAGGPGAGAWGELCRGGRLPALGVLRRPLADGDPVGDRPRPGQRCVAAKRDGPGTGQRRVGGLLTGGHQAPSWWHTGQTRRAARRSQRCWVLAVASWNPHDGQDATHMPCSRCNAGGGGLVAGWLVVVG